VLVRLGDSNQTELSGVFYRECFDFERPLPNYLAAGLGLTLPTLPSSLD
jgi:hypothetical protein